MPTFNDFLPANTRIKGFPRLKLKYIKNWVDDIEAVWQPTTQET